MRNNMQEMWEETYNGIAKVTDLVVLNKIEQEMFWLFIDEMLNDSYIDGCYNNETYYFEPWDC